MILTFCSILVSLGLAMLAVWVLGKMFDRATFKLLGSGIRFLQR